MKIGDLVRFIGFEEYRILQNNDDISIGVIVAIHEVYGKTRYDVSWPNGSFGTWLYPETLKVIHES